MFLMARMWCVLHVNVWLLWLTSVKMVFSDKRVVAKTSFKVCSCVGFVLHWFYRMLISINCLALQHLTKAYNHVTTSSVPDWEVPRLSRVLMVRSPSLPAGSLKPAALQNLKEKESMNCFVKWSLPHYPNHTNMLRAEMKIFSFFSFNSDSGGKD